MLTNDDYRRILKRPEMTDEEVNVLRTELEAFLNRALDEYFALASPRPDGI